MADNLTAEQRKKNMQNIKSKDTKIELALRKALWSKGYRYRKNYYVLNGENSLAGGSKLRRDLYAAFRTFRFAPVFRVTGVTCIAARFIAVKGKFIRILWI